MLRAHTPCLLRGSPRTTTAREAPESGHGSIRDRRSATRTDECLLVGSRCQLQNIIRGGSIVGNLGPSSVGSSIAIEALRMLRRDTAATAALVGGERIDTGAGNLQLLTRTATHMLPSRVFRAAAVSLGA